MNDLCNGLDDQSLLTIRKEKFEISVHLLCHFTSFSPMNFIIRLPVCFRLFSVQKTTNRYLIISNRLKPIKDERKNVHNYRLQMQQKSSFNLQNIFFVYCGSSSLLPNVEVQQNTNDWRVCHFEQSIFASMKRNNGLFVSRKKSTPKWIAVWYSW